MDDVDQLRRELEGLWPAQSPTPGFNTRVMDAWAQRASARRARTWRWRRWGGVIGILMVGVALLATVRGSRTSPEAHAQADAADPIELAAASPSVRAPRAPWVVPEDLEARVADHVRSYGAVWGSEFAFHGVIAVSVGDQALQQWAFGEAEPEVAHTVASRFRWGSAGQHVLAAAVWRLITEERLSLETPLGEVEPQWRPAADRALTIGELLGGDTDLPGPREAEIQTCRERWLYACRKMPALDRLIAARLANGYRAETRKAGLPETVLLAHVIETVTRMPLERALRELVLDPSGAESTRVGRVDSQLVCGHVFDEGNEARRPIDNFEVAPSWDPGVTGTVADLIAIQRALRPDGALGLSMAHDLFSPDSEDDGGAANGFGWTTWVRQRIHGNEVRAVVGGSEGYTTTVLHFYEDDVVVTVSSNSEAVDARVIAVAVADLAFGRVVEPVQERAETPMPRAELLRLMGEWVLTAADELRVREADPGMLRLVHSAHVASLAPGPTIGFGSPLGGKRLHRESEDHYFVKDRAGTRIELQSGGTRLRVSAGETELTYKRPAVRRNHIATPLYLAVPGSGTPAPDGRDG